MPVSLSKEHRRLLEKTTAAARVLAESACRAALENLAVHEKTFRSHMSDPQKKLRNSLRARGRALGDQRDDRSGLQDIYHLTELAAYEHWHRLLFTRFLTENNLLITDKANGNVPVTLEECEELAPELGVSDGLDLACRFAGRTLPGVFRSGDPVLDLPIALNDQVELRKLLSVLPSETFRADDALGWTYQFWQAQRKNEVNKSGKKIGANEIAPVTQLFTEDYMVEFLLHNTIGAWWAGKMGPIQADTEEEARAKVALPARDGVPGISWTYLRLVQDENTKTWRPAAGTFEGWPKFARLIRLLDPCMGSGHFLVFALPILVRLRMEEENLTPQAAVIAALKDNIHGLEIDERCTQIAAFNVALTAWKLAGYQALPSLNLACSGFAPGRTEDDWVAIAGDNDRLQRGMVRLYSLFKNAPVLGSLINPRAQGRSLIEAEFKELSPLLTAAIASSDNENRKFENDTVELSAIAQGLAKAAEILACEFILVATNVPYLGDRKQAKELKEFCQRVYRDSKADLSTVFVERSTALLAQHGCFAGVTPQSWLFQSSYSNFRKNLLKTQSWNFVIWLGEHGFESSQAAGAFTALIVFEARRPKQNESFAAFNLGNENTPNDKATALATSNPRVLDQMTQIMNPESRVLFETLGAGRLLEKYAEAPQGIITGDMDKWQRCFWEVYSVGTRWQPFLSATTDAEIFSGREGVIDWSTNGDGMIRPRPGNRAVSRQGVAINQMRNLLSTIYCGELYDGNVAPIVTMQADHTVALWAYCSSESFIADLRGLDKKVNVTNGTILKVPFNLAHWQKIAAAGLKGGKSKTLEDWLRDEFFAQHAKLFHDRPFIWHLWDGRADGFHALVNYHKLDHAMLQKLTYSYLGNWIQQQSEDAKADKPGAADRLGVAQTLQSRLAAILEGEAPLDIFVRWKPLKDQAQGWHPDLNDGIRQNIRPFLMAGDVGKKGAGLFRAIPLKLKDKDRGKEPHRPIEEYPWFWCEEEPGTDPMGGEEFAGARWNNVHLTLAGKKEAIS